MISAVQLVALALVAALAVKRGRATVKSKTKADDGALTFGDLLTDPLSREFVSRSDPRRNRIFLPNQAAIKVARPGFDEKVDAENPPPNYWLNAEAHTNPDGSITFVDGRKPLHSLVREQAEYLQFQNLEH